MAYRLMFDCEQLQTPLLDAQMALSKLRLCDLFWVAWTEFGGVGEGHGAQCSRFPGIWSKKNS